MLDIAAMQLERLLSPSVNDICLVCITPIFWFKGSSPPQRNNIDRHIRTTRNLGPRDVIDCLNDQSMNPKAFVLFHIEATVYRNHLEHAGFPYLHASVLTIAFTID